MSSRGSFVVHDDNWAGLTADPLLDLVWAIVMELRQIQ